MTPVKNVLSAMAVAGRRWSESEVLRFVVRQLSQCSEEEAGASRQEMSYSRPNSHNIVLILTRLDEAK